MMVIIYKLYCLFYWLPGASILFFEQDSFDKKANLIWLWESVGDGAMVGLKTGQISSDKLCFVSRGWLVPTS